MQNLRTWPLTTVVRRDRFSTKLWIEGIEVEFDPVKEIYVEKTKGINKSEVIYI